MASWSCGVVTRRGSKHGVRQAVHSTPHTGMKCAFQTEYGLGSRECLSDRGHLKPFGAVQQK
eukprot:9580396-Alexandrium_andersonii.AAC.1